MSTQDLGNNRALAKKALNWFNKHTGLSLLRAQGVRV
jgi:hypothetical protein